MKRFSSLFFLATLLLPVLRAAYSPPVGGMTYTAPNGQTRSMSIPLMHGSAGAGKMIGRIEAVGSNYIDDSTAGWTAGALSIGATPYYLRIKTGAQAGRILLVSTTVANTTTRVTVNNDGADLTQCGITTGSSTGDLYELVLADTLINLFGSSTLQGGTDWTTVDNVQIWGGASWTVYYYNTTRTRWERNIDDGSSATRDNTVLRPDRGIMITRRAGTDLTFRLNGRVPDVTPQFVQSRPGVTFLSTGVPASITLGALALQTRAGWQPGSALSSNALSAADLIQVWGGASWTIYFYDSDGGHWMRTIDDPGTNRDTTPIPVGRPIMVRRLNTAANAAERVVSLLMPYTISQ